MEAEAPRIIAGDGSNPADGVTASEDPTGLRANAKSVVTGPLRHFAGGPRGGTHAAARLASTVHWQ